MEQMDKQPQPEVRMRFIQSRLPTELYEWLRLRAFLLRQSMNSIVLEAVADYRTAVEAGEGTPAQGAPERDAIGKYKWRGGRELYAWLRTNALFARRSLHTLP